jgi:Rieske 2Fe-2S family protein
MPTTYINARPTVDVAEATTLPQEFYTDPDLFRREMETIHFDMWLAAGRAEQLKQPGDFFVCEVANASVVVLRDDSSSIRAFHNTCRHRGTLLCAVDHGNLAGRIQCPYHAWTYRLDGTLANAPHMEKVEGFRESQYSLRAVHTATWDGHIFINLSPNPMRFEEHLARLVEKFRPWRMEELRLVERRTYSLAANWKLIIQNYSECLHCPIAHPQLQKNSHYMSGDNEAPSATILGGRMDLRDGVTTLTMSGRTTRNCLPGLTEEDRRRVYYYCLLPNFLLNLHPDYMLTFTVWPRAVDRTDIVCEWHFHPDEIAKSGFDPKDAIEFWEITNRQDWELSERAQKGIASKGYQPGPYSNREELLIALDQFVLDRLNRRPAESQGR